MNNMIKDLVNEIKDLMEEHLEAENDEYTFGSLLAYMEVLTIIHDDLQEEERAAYGLDFDVDKYYLERIDKMKKPSKSE